MTTSLKRGKRAVEFVQRTCVRGALMSVALALSTAAPVAAQPVGPPAVTMTSEDLGALFDERAIGEMKKADVAGAAVVVVRDGTVVFARGYGYADVERKISVSASGTMFRIASVSKVVTYTAVMQLVEQGRIDLDSDVARYLDFPIPATFAEPITMRHLMAHTAGFEETVRGRWVKPGQLVPQRDYLVQRMPRRLFAPGSTPAYSTYGTALAGYIVERVSGEPFETYVQRHIFLPLGMQHSSFAQPLPAPLAPLMAKGYATASAPASPFDIAQVPAAASMSSSVTDMARFMLAHLGHAASPGPSLLRPETLATMHSGQFRHHRAGPAVALGLYEMDEVAPRLIGHTGDIPGFHSGMYLFPEQRTGLFIVQNTEAGTGMRNALLKAFATRYFKPPATAAALPRVDSADESGQISGSYRTTWRFDSSPLSLKYLMEQSVVRTVGPGTLMIDTYVGKPIKFHRVGPGIWQNAADPQRRIFFSRNPQGNWAMSSNRNPVFILQKSPWYRHKLLLLTVLPAALLVELLSVLAWPMSALMRGRAAADALLSPQVLRARYFMRVVALLALAPWLLYGSIALVVMNDLLFVASAACAMLLRGVQLLAWVSAAGTVAAMWAAWTVFRMREAGGLRRAHYTLLSMACLGTTAMAWQGGLLFWDGRF